MLTFDLFTSKVNFASPFVWAIYIYIESIEVTCRSTVVKIVLIGNLRWPSSGLYLLYSRLSLSRTPRDSFKYFEISVPRHIRFAELRKKLIRLTTFNKYMCNWTLEVRDILKILWKRGEIAP